MPKARLSEAARKRVRVGRMLKSGKSPTEIARAVGVARQTVHAWKAILEGGGLDALRDVPESGRPSRLDETERAAMRQMLLQSPTAHGFGTELWTLKRVGVLIKRKFGIVYGKTQVWRILGALGFSPQKPEKRAIERNEDAVQDWKRRTWPAPKKSQAPRPFDRFYR